MSFFLFRKLVLLIPTDLQILLLGCCYLLPRAAELQSPPLTPPSHSDLQSPLLKQHYLLPTSGAHHLTATTCCRPLKLTTQPLLPADASSRTPEPVPRLHLFPPTSRGHHSTTATCCWPPDDLQSPQPGRWLSPTSRAHRSPVPNQRLSLLG